MCDNDPREREQSMKSEIRALSLWRPWPWAFINGPEERRKRIENRSLTPPKWMIGQYLALHSAQRWDAEAIPLIEEQLGVDVPPKEEHPAGVIFAVAKLVRVIAFDLDADVQEVPYDQQGWFFGPFGWLLDDVTRIDPVECKGRQGLWTLPAGVLVAVRERYWTVINGNRQLATSTEVSEEKED